MEARPSTTPSPFQSMRVKLILVRDAPGLLVETHQHLYHEFDFVLGGHGVFHCGRNSYEVRTGDIVYVARGVRHRRESSIEAPLSICNIDVPERLLREPASTFKPWPLLQRWRGSGTPKEASSAFSPLIPMMQKGSFAEELAEPLQRTVCKHLAAALDFQSELLGRKAPSLFTLAQRILLHPELKLSLAVEAASAGVSKCHLCRSFRNEFGIGMIEYRDLARIELAICMLKSGGMSVKDIGAMLGYSSKSHFINAFKRVAGSPPGRFRKH